MWWRSAGQTMVDPAQDMVLPRGQLIPAGLTREASQAWAEHWLDEEVPALKGRTPGRQSYQTGTGRCWRRYCGSSNGKRSYCGSSSGKRTCAGTQTQPHPAAGSLPGCASNSRCPSSHDHDRRSRATPSQPGKIAQQDRLPLPGPRLG
jgi:hypothetical protein